VTTEELLELVLDHRLRGLHTSMPGQVQSYDAASQTADILPQLKRQIPDGDGGFTVEDLPVLPGVPVCFPRGGGCFVSFPLQKGDFVLVVFAERAIGNWRQKGQASNPGDLRMHPLAGAQAIPCNLYPSSQALQSADANNMVLGRDGTPAAQISITDALVKLGGGDQFVALANLVMQRLNTIQDKFDNHTHTTALGSCTAGGATGAVASAVPDSTIGTLADVAAQNVKAT